MLVDLLIKLLDLGSNVAEGLFWLGVVFILCVLMGITILSTGLLVFAFLS